MSPEELANRQCGLCHARDIPRTVAWSWWVDGRPVHWQCALRRSREQALEDAQKAVGACQTLRQAVNAIRVLRGGL